MLSLIQIGFSFADIRRMTMADFIAYTDLYIGTDKGDDEHQEVARKATQDDIDALLS